MNKIIFCEGETDAIMKKSKQVRVLRCFGRLLRQKMWLPHDEIGSVFS